VSRGRIDWRWPLAIILVVILFIPMRRYALPVNLPFELEPYRVIVALVVVVWVLSLLAQPDVAFRRSGLDGPVLLYAFSLVASDLANPARIAQYQSLVIRGLSLALSIIVVFYFVVSVVRSFSQVVAIVKLLVAGTSVLAFLALIESRTGWSPFSNLDRYVPLLQQMASFEEVARGTFRAVGSAEGPIALGALFAVITPLSLYLAIRFGRWWWMSVVLLMGGAFATVSRTAVLMLAVASLVVLVLRFRESWRFAPLLIPMVVMVHFAVPGALGAMKTAFAPPGGLINEHTQDEYVVGSGRLADIGPSLELFSKKPVLGYGYGTLKTDGPDANARIVDNQWLFSLLNVGLVGVFALVWLFMRFIRSVGRWAFQERTDDGWLLVALVASVAAFGVGMFTLDAFAFTQVTFVFFVILALGSALALAPDPVPAPSFEASPARGLPNGRIGEARRPALSAR
jgi:polysaccharide biosynthesis protein PslJ